MIYQDVEVRGIAKWFVRSWRLFEFEIQEFAKAPERKPLRSALDGLRDAGGKAWENVTDPEALLEELRG